MYEFNHRRVTLKIFFALSYTQNQSPTTRQQDQKQLPMTTSTISSTLSDNVEASCTLDCGSGGSCYLESDSSTKLSRGTNNVDSKRVNDPEIERQKRRRRKRSNSIDGVDRKIQRCQCPLGRGGDRCQQGWWMFFFLSDIKIVSSSNT